MRLMPQDFRSTVAVLAPSFPPGFRGGGPARTLDALTRAAPVQYDVRVVTPNRDAGEPVPMDVVSGKWTSRAGVAVFYAPLASIKDLVRMYREIQRLRPDVLYLNSLFNFSFSILPRFLGAIGVWGDARILLAPRGELDPGALRIRGMKKRAFLWLYRELGLWKRVIWHASSTAEARAIRDTWGPAVNIVIRENETLLPARALEPKQHSGALRAVFMSRLSVKKGLLLALQAMSDIPVVMNFDVYGPEEDARYVAECRAQAKRVSSNVHVSFRGPVVADAVREVLSEYDVMLFPTAGENFGHVIAEALSAACPVLTTDTTPWSELLREGAGEVVNEDIESWRLAILRFAEMSASERLKKREAAATGYSKWRARSDAPHVFDLLDR